MAIVIEDGTGKTDSETYASVAEFTTYLSNRGLSLTTDTDANKEQLLRKASDYIESLWDKIQGLKTNTDQALQFPRYGVWLYDEYLDNDEIPKQLKDAQIQLAYDMESTDAFPVSNGKAVLRRKVDVIDTTYARPSIAPTPVFTKFDAMFAPFLKNGGHISFGRTL